MKNEIPVIGKTYNYFDDGKIKESRRSQVVVVDVIPFDKIDDETLRLWKEEVEECYWIYENETDYFIKANLIEFDEDLIFVRAKNNQWFSFNSFVSDGVLDVDGSLNECLKK